MPVHVHICRGVWGLWSVLDLRLSQTLHKQDWNAGKLAGLCVHVLEGAALCAFAATANSTVGCCLLCAQRSKNFAPMRQTELRLYRSPVQA
jgi:hypothetical protein